MSSHASSSSWSLLAGTSASSLSRDGERIHGYIPQECSDGRIRSRAVTVLRHSGKVYCFDSTCYHAGGPLGLGDIEEVGGDPCVVCPWHAYKVSLTKGGKYYEALEMRGGKLVPSGLKVKSRAQRLHNAEKRADGIYVKLNRDGSCASDEYGYTSMCGKRDQGKVGRDGILPRQRAKRPLRSGHVLNPPLKIRESKRDLKAWSRVSIVSRIDEAKDAVRVILKFENKEDTIFVDEGVFAHHVELRAHVDGKEIVRSYTPVRTPSKREIELSVRVYASGAMSRVLESLPLGASLDIRLGGDATNGSLNRLIERLRRSKWDVSSAYVGLAAAGSGITPMYQLAESVLLRFSSIRVVLIVCNKSADRIMLGKELECLSKSHHPRLFVSHVLGTRNERMDVVLLQKRLAEAVSGAANAGWSWCGPPSFNRSVPKMLSNMGMGDEFTIHAPFL